MTVAVVRARFVVPPARDGEPAGEATIAFPVNDELDRSVCEQVSPVAALVPVDAVWTVRAGTENVRDRD